IDAHVHVARDPDHDGALYLSAGVTSARDTGGVLDSLLALRARALAGGWAGPRLRICGPLIDGAPTVWPAAMSLIVGEEGDGRAAVDQLAGAVDQIKVYSGVGPELTREIVQRARAYAIPVTGDLAATKASEAVDAGIAGLERMGRLDDPAVTDAPEVALMLEGTRAFWAERVAGRARAWTETDYETARRAFEVEVAFVGETIAAGATILVGSDAPNPFV